MRTNPIPWMIGTVAGLGIALTCSLAFAVETTMAIRVLSKDAKFIGTAMAGASVTITDAATGTLLAEGVTAGSTGDTVRLMKTALRPGTPLSTEGSAVFTTTIDLTVPTQLQFSAFGPLSHPDSANRVSVTQWVVPGKHLTGGDGLLLHLPGFAIDVAEPVPTYTPQGMPKDVTLHATVTMMCGCPITPGGLWDANQYEITSLLYQGGQQMASAPLAYAGSASRFAGTIPLSRSGAYEVVVYAYNPANGNTGLGRTTFTVK